MHDIEKERPQIEHQLLDVREVSIIFMLEDSAFLGGCFGR